MRTPTNNFYSLKGARKFFRNSQNGGLNAKQVKEKIQAGEISIGEPILAKGETVIGFDGDGRYWTEKA